MNDPKPTSIPGASLPKEQPMPATPEIKKEAAAEAKTA